MCSRTMDLRRKRPMSWSERRGKEELYPSSMVTNISSDKERLITCGGGERVHVHVFRNVF